MRLLSYLKSIDKFLLIFLTVFTIDKVVVKPLLIVFGLVGVWKYLSIKDLKKAPGFYMFIVLLAAVNFIFINKDWTSPHIISFGIGICYWLMCLAAFFVVKKRIEINELVTTERTLDVYFLFNTVWSFGNLALAMYHSGSINPYMLDDEAYSTSTGDYIKGVLMGPSYLNMLVNCFFCVFYLYRGKYIFAVIAVMIACLTTSNFANIVLLAALMLLLVVLKKKQARLTILIQMAVVAGFYLVVSNTNLRYAMGSFRDLAQKEQAQKAEPVKEEPAVTQVPTMPGEQPFDVFKYKYGKILSFEQTYNYLKESPKNLIFGAGLGSFSSQLAERTSNLPVPKKSRVFQRVPVYMSAAFLQNHYKVFYAIYSLPMGYHSIRHFPNSFVNQILGEYGLLGLVLFLVYYVYYIFRNGRSLSYTWIMGLFLAYFLVFDYLFEYLSVVVFFEVFFLTDLKRKAIS